MNFESVPEPNPYGVQRGPDEVARGGRATRPVAPDHAIGAIHEHLWNLRTYTARNNEQAFGKLPGDAQHAADMAFIRATLDSILNVLGFEKTPKI